jgi:hypothetical protein
MEAAHVSARRLHGKGHDLPGKSLPGTNSMNPFSVIYGAHAQHLPVKFPL